MDASERTYVRPREDDGLWVTEARSSGPRPPGTPPPAATGSRRAATTATPSRLAKRLKAMGVAEVPERRRPAHERARLRRSRCTPTRSTCRADGARRGSIFVNSHERPVPRARSRSTFIATGVRRDGARRPSTPTRCSRSARSASRASADQLDWPDERMDGRQRRDRAYRFRVDHLRRVPAAVRFLSCEPLLGPARRARPRGHPLGHRRRRVRPTAAADGPAMGD